MNAGAGFNQADVSGENDGGTITSSLRVEGVKCDAACRKRLHGLAEHRPVLGGITESPARPEMYSLSADEYSRVTHRVANTGGTTGCVLLLLFLFC